MSTTKFNLRKKELKATKKSPHSCLERIFSFEKRRDVEKQTRCYRCLTLYCCTSMTFSSAQQKFVTIIAIPGQLMPKKLVHMFETAKMIQNCSVSTTELH